MNAWVLWTVRIVAVSFGLFVALSVVASAFDSESDLSTIAGAILTGAGMLGIYVATAINLPGLWRQLGVTTRVPGGLQGRRRATRQIDGKEPYFEHEIPTLRWLAERRVAERHWSATTWLTWISLIAFCAGFALRPLQFAPTTGNDVAVYAVFMQGLQFLVMILRLVTAVTAVLLVAVVIAKRRRPDDTKAEAFLARTQPVPWPTDEGR